LQILNSQEKETITRSLFKLEKWIENNGVYGFDPYDVKGTRLAIIIHDTKYVNFLFNNFLGVFPSFSRKFFKIKKHVYPTSMGIFSEGYLNLYRYFKDEKYLKKAVIFLEWLEKNRNPKYNYYNWGRPFDWKTRIFIPKDIPCTVGNSIIANAFLNIYEETKEETYPEIAKSICEFIAKKMNIDFIDENQICFSYTPIDNFHIHNSNLFASHLLFRMGHLTNNEDYLSLAEKSLNYSLNQQNKDGSWYYWGSPDKLLYLIDNYHTGFFLRSLYGIYKLTNNQKVKKALKRGYTFYKNNFFVNSEIPKFTNKSLYPIDIQSCSESVLCLSMLSEDKSFEDAFELAKNVALWTCKNMQDKSGYFFYRISSAYISKIPYLKCGQAPMLNALSRLLLANNKIVLE
jgi:hypothetical protein